MGGDYCTSTGAHQVNIGGRANTSALTRLLPSLRHAQTKVSRSRLCSTGTTHVQIRHIRPLTVHLAFVRQKVLLVRRVDMIEPLMIHHNSD